MDMQALSGLALFATVSSITPGPNNMMVMASGANYGFRRTVPHLLGISIGFTVMVAMVGAGLVRIFDAFPASYTAMRIASVLYLSYLAFRIATAMPAGKGQDAAGRPFTFLQAAAFQWVNPKAWTMALAAVTAYTPVPGMAGVFIVATVFGVLNLPCVSTWAALGEGMGALLADPRRIRIFNVTMAVLLMASLYPVLRG